MLYMTDTDLEVLRLLLQTSSDKICISYDCSSDVNCKECIAAQPIKIFKKVEEMNNEHKTSRKNNR